MFLLARLSLVAVLLTAACAHGHSAPEQTENAAEAANVRDADRLFREMKWPEAAAAYETIAAGASSNGHWWFRLGSARRSLHQYERAADAFERSLALGYSPRVALRDLAFAQSGAGRIDQSIDALNRLLDIGYDNAGRLQAEPDLAAARKDPRFAAILQRAATNVRPGVTEFGWAPDGQHLAIAVDRRGVSAVFTLDLDGTAMRRITDDTAWSSMPAWSPNGSQLAFVSGAPGARRIWIAKTDGSAKTQVSHGPGNDHYPQWSPNGKSIVFNSDRSGRRQVLTIDVASGSETVLTDAPGNSDYASWDKDGRALIFESDRSGVWSIYTMNADGTAQQQRLLGSAPVLFPDGRRIVYHDAIDGDDFDVYVANRDGSAPRQLTTEWSRDREPRPSPDGHWIAFFSDRTGNNELYVMRADGTQLRQITRIGDQHTSDSFNTRSHAFRR